jgi:hypothetical protein
LKGRFRKMRRLEPGLWDNYLRDLGSPRPEDMIIYQWRDVSDAIEDFIALANFRQASANLSTYVGAIVMLGAAGSAAQSLFTSVGSYFFLCVRRPTPAGC